MTWSWSLPIRVVPTAVLLFPRLRPEKLRVVVPTYRDWEGARETVDSLLECAPPPKEIVLVNDNSEPGLPPWVERTPIILVDYAGNRGPSYARNAGAQIDTGSCPEWLYFTDTGCTRGRDFFWRFVEEHARMPLNCVAVAGPVVGVCDSPLLSPINVYMSEEKILNPPFDSDGPQAVVTANAAVSARAFRAVGGFDTSYPFAAGEDLDLGIKLRQMGTIGWAPSAVVQHRFAESTDDFRRRFLRYGAGTAHLEHRLGLPSLRPTPFAAASPALQPLAYLHVTAMQAGYDAHWQELAASIRRLGTLGAVVEASRMTSEAVVACGRACGSPLHRSTPSLKSARTSDLLSNLRCNGGSPLGMQPLPPLR